MVILEKGQKVNLKKSQSGLGEILINLNWNARPVSTAKKQGFFSRLFGEGEGGGIDLDLGCLWELKDGSKGSVQALGKNFGNLNSAPFVALDGDDRTGENSAGENLRINGNQLSKIKRILVYTFIYEGVANWKQADGVVTIKYPKAEDIVVKMNEYDTNKTMCGLVLLENLNDETFSVERVVQFYSGHRSLDEAFHWGLRWVAGKKD